MAWIKTVSPSEATGLAAQLYQGSGGGAGRARETIHVMSLKPNMMQYHADFTAEMRSPAWKTTPKHREMLAVVVSAISHCKF